MDVDTSSRDNDSRPRERYRVAGDKVLGKIKELLHEGRIRRIIIRDDDDNVLIELPLSFGVVGAVLLGPMWAAIGAVAALVSKCSIEIERDDEDEGAGDVGEDVGEDVGAADEGASDAEEGG